MFPILLTLHSLVRWLVLISLLFAIYRGFRGWRSGSAFSAFDNSVRHWTATIVHIQLILGLWLYFISPLTDYFLHHFSEAVHERTLRFFGMEHSLMMFVAITVITIGSAKARRKSTDKDKYKTMTLWYTAGLLLILTSVPWAFSPLVSRPWLRWF